MFNIQENCRDVKHISSVILNRTITSHKVHVIISIHICASWHIQIHQIKDLHTGFCTYVFHIYWIDIIIVKIQVRFRTPKKKDLLLLEGQTFHQSPCVHHNQPLQPQHQSLPWKLQLPFRKPTFHSYCDKAIWTLSNFKRISLFSLYADCEPLGSLMYKDMCLTKCITDQINNWSKIAFQQKHTLDNNEQNFSEKKTLNILMGY